jgi:hypothetical protein
MVTIHQYVSKSEFAQILHENKRNFQTINGMDSFILEFGTLTLVICYSPEFNDRFVVMHSEDML